MQLSVLLGRLFWIVTVLTPGFALATSPKWMRHRRYLRDDSRTRRQAFGGEPQQIDLNITVPFIFSARLYPYGERYGDSALGTNVYSQAFVLNNELTYYGEKHSVIYILRDGAIAFSPDVQQYNGDAFPRGPKIIAPYWTPSSLAGSGKVYFRETTARNIIQLASSEVGIQYHYPQSFKPSSVVVVTWENIAPPGASKALEKKDRNIFQVALILSNNGSFAHVVYSKMKWGESAKTGFNDGLGNSYIDLPGSGTPTAMRLANLSDIGIPGEWLFKLDGGLVYLCGPGFKGLECVDFCSTGEFYYDCSRRCHCVGGTCDTVNGRCPGVRPTCEEGWVGSPKCDLDVDECEVMGANQLCKSDAPDCINTPGAFICTCLAGYDNDTRVCKGHENSKLPHPRSNETLQVLPQQPSVIFINPNVVSNGNVRVVPNPNAPASNGGHPTPSAGPAPGAPPSGTFVGTDVRPLNPFLSTETTSQSAPVSIKLFTTIGTPSTAAPTTLAPSTTEAPTTKIPLTTTDRKTYPTLAPISATPKTTQKPFVCDLECGENARCKFTGTVQKRTKACICNEGWSGDGQFCVDINECFVTNACENNAQCQNTLGSYRCLCAPGFELLNGDCIDINECAEGVVSCPGGNTAHCVNTHGGHECRCRQGYNGNPTSILGCIDINECLIPTFYCGEHSSCQNSQGGFKCSCHEGFVTNEETGSCDDIDECEQGPCSAAAECINLPGKFSCNCLQGYVGDGFTCNETILYPFNRLQVQRLPQENDALAEVILAWPVHILGNLFDRAYISSNGAVTFDKPLRSYVDRSLEQLDYVGLFPLYFPVDMQVGGTVYFTQSSDKAAITRASLNIQEEFNEPNYVAENVFLTTYEDVAASSQTSVKSTFQVILTSSQQGTYATFIYDKLNAPFAQAGVVAGPHASTFILPGSNGNTDYLRRQSNVKSPGKWIIRLDLPNLIGCPAGFTGSPLCEEVCQVGFWGQNCTNTCNCRNDVMCNASTGACDDSLCREGFEGEDCMTDVDECKMQLAKCSPLAVCVNLRASYSCNCQPGYTGDGLSCIEITPCFTEQNLVCSEHAYCAQPGVGQLLVCVCRPGYNGDGVHCQRDIWEPTTETTTQTTTITTTTVTTMLATQKSTKSSGVDFFFASNTTSAWSPPQAETESTERMTVTSTLSPTISRTTNGAVAATDLGIDNRVDVVATPEVVNPVFASNVPLVTSRPTTAQQATPAIDEVEIDENSVKASHGAKRDDEKELKETKTGGISTSNLLVIVIPAVLCGIWLICIVALLIVCCRRRRQRQREKYGLSYYAPPSTGSGKATSVTNTASHGYGYSPAPSQSQFSIPRPQPGGYGDFYNTGYFGDPYSQYKSY